MLDAAQALLRGRSDPTLGAARALGVLAALALAACGSPAPAAPELAYADASELATAGPELEAAAASSCEALGAHIDWAELARRSIPEDVRGRQAVVMQREAQTSLQATGTRQLLRPICDNDWRFRGVAERDGRPVARFRLLLAQGGFAMQDWVLARRPGGPLRVVDFHTMVTGEYLSETLRQVFASLLPQEGLLDRLLGRGSSTLDDIRAVRAMADANNAGRPADALAHYEALPARLQDQRAVQLVRIQAASNLDDVGYLHALDDAGRRFPGDPAFEVAQFDAHYLREDWPACLEDVRALQEAYPDPYIDYLEADVHLHAGDAARAMEVADRVIAAEPTLVEGHDVALLAATGLGRADRAREELMWLETEADVDTTSLLSMDGYEAVGPLLSAPE